jgi:pyruvyltransferase
MTGVELFHWNPRRPVFRGRVGRRLPLRRQVNNFGDLIGPMVVGRVLDELGLDPATGHGRLLSVGSVLHFSRPGDVVWGSGINGKQTAVDGGGLRICAVRGPRTREVLLRSCAEVPEVFGDPALLWPRYWSRQHYLDARPERHAVTLVPNLHDWYLLGQDPRAVSPRAPVHEVVGRIARSDLVVGSSLHGIVLADAFGVPARFVAPRWEPSFKYDDYLLGTGREPYPPSRDVDTAVRDGGHPPPTWDPAPLLAAFPVDLWSPTARAETLDHDN